MKRLFFVALVAMATMSYTASAQFKVDKEGIQKGIAKSEADITNPKKAAKAATWLSRGDKYFKAETEATSGLYVGMDAASAGVMFGSDVKPEAVEVEGQPFEKYAFTYFDAYFKEGKLVFWESDYVVVDDAIGTAIESYNTAFDKDAGSASKVAAKLSAVSDYYKSNANNYFQARKYKDAAAEFVKSYEVGILPALNSIDTAAIYNAGYLYTATEEFQKGVDALEEAAKYGYVADGQSHFFRGVCLIGLEKFDEAKAVLLEGIEEFPANNDIVEGLMSLYATTGEDPSEVIPYVEKAIAGDPTNYIYYDGLGRIYDKLGDNDKCLAAFEKAAELAPEEFSTQFNLGMLYIRKGNSMYDVIRELPNASQEDYDNANAQQIVYFKNSIAPLEKAISIRPESTDALEALKNVSFRLRNEEGMQAKYDKYNEMLKALQ